MSWQFQNEYKLFLSTRASQLYPISLTCTDWPFSKTFILDLSLLLPPGSTLDTLGFYISRVISRVNSIDIYIAYNGTLCGVFAGIPPDLEIQDISSTNYYTYADITSSANTSLYNISGKIIVGCTSGVSTIDSLTAQQSKISPNCVHSYLFNCVRSISCNGKTLTGLIELIAGPGIVLDTDGNTIIIKVDYAEVFQDVASVDLAVGAIYNKIGTPVKSINGVSPDDNGNISVSGLDCVSVKQVGRGSLSIANNCAKPCCLNTSTESMQLAVLTIKSEQLILKNYFILQATNINYMQANLSTLIGAK